jgi:hypothetical protein
MIPMFTKSISKMIKIGIQQNNIGSVELCRYVNSVILIGY